MTKPILFATLALGACLAPIPSHPLRFSQLPPSPQSTFDADLPEMKTLIEAERPAFEVLKISATHDDWELVRHEYSGNPIRRIAGVRFVLRHRGAPNCFYAEAVFAQRVELDQSWGKLRLVRFPQMYWHSRAQEKQLGETNVMPQSLDGVEVGAIPCDVVASG